MSGIKVSILLQIKIRLESLVININLMFEDTNIGELGKNISLPISTPIEE